MPFHRKQIIRFAGLSLTFAVVGGFSLALPGHGNPVRIEELRLVAEEAHPFDLSVRTGLDAHTLLEARSNIDVTTPSTVVNNTNIDVTTPSTVVNNTNIDVTTPSTVVNNTNIDVTTPSTVVSSTNTGVTTPDTVVSGDMDGDESLRFFPTHAELPEPHVAPGAAVSDPNTALK